MWCTVKNSPVGYPDVWSLFKFLLCLFFIYRPSFRRVQYSFFTLGLKISCGVKRIQFYAKCSKYNSLQVVIDGFNIAAKEIETIIRLYKYVSLPFLLVPAEVSVEILNPRRITFLPHAATNTTIEPHVNFHNLLQYYRFIICRVIVSQR